MKRAAPPAPRPPPQAEGRPIRGRGGQRPKAVERSAGREAPNVAVQNRQSLPVDLRRVRRTVRTVLEALGVWDHEISVTLVDDREIRALNARYLGVSRATDVLAFPLTGPAPVLGDAIISVETARRQARAFGHSLPEELDLLCCHACLHLVGYDDREPLEGRLMHAREMELLGRLYERPAPSLHVVV